MRIEIMPVKLNLAQCLTFMFIHVSSKFGIYYHLRRVEREAKESYCMLCIFSSDLERGVAPLGPPTPIT